MRALEFRARCLEFGHQRSLALRPLLAPCEMQQRRDGRKNNEADDERDADDIGFVHLLFGSGGLGKRGRGRDQGRQRCARYAEEPLRRPCDPCADGAENILV
ncbi:MAG: hypothetical protein KDJ40_01145 [Hyphomicrobiales bacterium]|nr:hypothetical protein [Hyphomicrobiales bacterium]